MSLSHKKKLTQIKVMKRNEDDRQFTSRKLQNSDNKSKKNISTSDQNLFSRLIFSLQSQMTAKENI